MSEVPLLHDRSNVIKVITEEFALVINGDLLAGPFSNELL